MIKALTYTSVRQVNEGEEMKNVYGTLMRNSFEFGPFMKDNENRDDG